MERIRSLDTNCFENFVLSNVHSRKVKLETKIRTQFISKGCRKFPKKEYIRCKLIRGHKRLLRKIMIHEAFVKELRESMCCEYSQRVYFNLLADSFLKYKNTLVDLIPVEMGPVNEIMKKKKMKLDHLEKSFNGNFCKEYFNKIETRESYYYYIEYLFSDFDCTKFIKKFGFKCCNDINHSINCYLKWALLKKYCSEIVLEDLNIEPYFPEPSYLPIPSFF
jgi:hypothetical protein